MPAELVEAPLGIACVFSNGMHRSVEVGETPNPVLARELLLGLVGLVHPHGKIDAAQTVQVYVYNLRKLVDHLHEKGFTGSAAELTRPQLAGYWLGCGHNIEQTTRRMLASLHAQTPVLAPATLGMVQGRSFNPRRKRDRGSLQPYSAGEWERLEQACRRTVNASFAEHRRALEAAEAGQRPEGGRRTWTPENVRWLLREYGPLTNAQAAEFMGVSPFTIQWKWGSVTEAREELFPSTRVVLAYQLLFGVYSGVVPDGIAELGVGDVDWAGENTVLLDYVKGRTSKESLNLPKKAIRLLSRWLEHSQLMRSHAPAELREDLWVRHAPISTGSWHGGAVHQDVGNKWIREIELLGDDGAPLQLHRHRIRTSFESLRDRQSWHGSARATIDPNHSPKVEGDNYLTVTTPGQQDSVDGIIESAQGDLVRKAQPPMLLTDEQTADLAAGFPKVVEKLRLDESALAELLRGERDVFLASCADQLASPFGPAGKPCPARPWVCLLCPLAMFAPRHAANLLRMKAFFGRQWLQMPAEHFMAVFGPYASRVDEVIAALDRHDPALIAAASTEVADDDAELPLRLEEATR
ncbi:hypothetical protein [Amycolatopsis sp. cmx-4-61]|uniref:hypothetical protein n=1 Tax=Amycolatopsis sp. cmx-4-61 TaxID=2790937 RepID=UPI0039787D4B